MARKPIEMEVRGLQTPRERIWASILALKTGFTINQVQEGCNPMVLHGCVEDYFDDLIAAGYIRKIAEGKHVPGRPAIVMAGHRYDLVKVQFDAPRLCGGKPVTQGLGTLAMWRAMKVLGKGFDYRELAAAASQEGLVVKLEAAKSYVNVLARAGYFATLRAAKPGTPARYKLVKNTGPHAPAITRRKCVFDRNTAQFAELETAQEVCDGIPD